MNIAKMRIKKESEVMNELQIFKNEEFGEIRTIEVNNQPWFVGKDVADILGYRNGSRDINNHVEEEDRLKYQIGTAGQLREQTLINESGLYSLVLSSKLPTAKKFKRWVTSEVLPSIRKNGGYINGSEAMSDSEIMAKALLVAQKTIEANKEKINQLMSDNERMKPKALFADAVANSDGTILIGELAKLIKKNGYDIGQKRLFAWMRENGYLIKQKGSSYNMPTQRAMEMGLFKIKESSIIQPDGAVRLTRTVKVAGKGQQYFINKFLGEQAQQSLDLEV